MNYNERRASAETTKELLCTSKKTTALETSKDLSKRQIFKVFRFLKELDSVADLPSLLFALLQPRTHLKNV